MRQWHDRSSLFDASSEQKAQDGGFQAVSTRAASVEVIWISTWIKHDTNRHVLLRHWKLCTCECHAQFLCTSNCQWRASRFSDVSKGKEQYAIPIVNDVDDESYPTDYKYISNYVESVHMNINRCVNTLSVILRHTCTSLSVMLTEFHMRQMRFCTFTYFLHVADHWLWFLFRRVRARTIARR